VSGVILIVPGQRPYFLAIRGDEMLAMLSEPRNPLRNGLAFASLLIGGHDSDRDEVRHSAPDKGRRASCSNRVTTDYRTVKIGPVSQGPTGVLK
jgi:hypothetical protein